MIPKLSELLERNDDDGDGEECNESQSRMGIFFQQHIWIWVMARLLGTTAIHKSVQRWLSCQVPLASTNVCSLQRCKA